MINNNHKIKQQQQRVIQTKNTTDAYIFFNLLTNPQLLSVVEEQLPEHRERLYPPTTTLSLFLAQAMNADASCQNTVNAHAVERAVNGLSMCSTQTGGYCKARKRLPIEMVSTLTKHIGSHVAEQTPRAWRWKGRRIILIDGTTLSMPDTDQNQAFYPQQSGQQSGLGFPIARVVGMICLSSGVILDGAMGPFQGQGGNEHALFRQILDSVEAGDVVMADCYYCSYFLLAMLQEKGVDIVMQQHAARKTDFRKGQSLGKRDHIVQWQKPKIKPDWMDEEQYHGFPDTLTIRELKVKSKIYVTTLFNHRKTPKQAIADLYKQRWHIELDLRNIKTTLGLETLHCKTPEMNEKELWVYFLAYNLIRLLMAQAALHAGIVPREISFKHTLQIWISYSRQSMNVANEVIIFMLIAQQRVGNRGGRIEPRAVKRRSKPFPLLMKPRDQAREDVRKHGHPKKIK